MGTGVWLSGETRPSSSMTPTTIRTLPRCNPWVGTSVTFGSIPLGSFGNLIPSINVSITVNEFYVALSPTEILEELKIELNPRVTGQAKLEVWAQDASWERTWPLSGRIAFAAVPIGPFVIVPNLEPKARVYLQLKPSLYFQVQAGLDMTAGIHYEAKKGTTAYGDLTPINTISNPSVDLAVTGTATVGVMPWASRE